MLLQIDLTATEALAETSPGLFHAAVNDLTLVLLGDVGPAVLESGVGLWELLAGIALAWTGMKMALGQRLQVGDVILQIVTLMIPRTMLFFYGTALPGVGMNFPQILASQGAWLTEAILQDGISIMFAQVERIGTDYLQMWYGGEDGELGFVEGIVAAVKTVTSIWNSILTILPLTVMVLLGLVVAFVCLGQVVVAGFGLAVATCFGPLFIPWLVYSPMSFLFWGWFRTVLILTLYAPLAAAVLRVFGLTVLTWIEPLVAPNAGVGMTAATAAATVSGIITKNPAAALAASSVGILFVIGFSVIGLIAALKVPQLASSLVSGSGMGSGVGEMLGAAAAVGGSMVSGAAALRTSTAGLGRVGRR